MSETTSISANEISARIAKMRGRYLETDRYTRIQQSVDQIYRNRLAAISEDNQIEARGLVLIGATGSGKTMALNRVFRSLKLVSSEETQKHADFVSLSIPSPTTLKFIGQATLNALGYPLTRNQTAPYIWQLVRHHLKERKIKLLHYDEAHDLYSSSSNRELQYIVNTFKTLLQDKNWPVSIILSGTQQLGQLLEFDLQLSRRLSVIRNKPLEPKRHQREIVEYLNAYASIEGLVVTGELNKPRFGSTHILASGGAFGFAIELIIDVIETVLLRGGTEIRLSDFANIYERKTGCSNYENPYLSPKPISHFSNTKEYEL